MCKIAELKVEQKGEEIARGQVWVFLEFLDKAPRFLRPLAFSFLVFP
jgi:hypothetical protein